MLSSFQLAHKSQHVNSGPHSRTAHRQHIMLHIRSGVDRISACSWNEPVSSSVVASSVPHWFSTKIASQSQPALTIPPCLLSFMSNTKASANVPDLIPIGIDPFIVSCQFVSLSSSRVLSWSNDIHKLLLCKIFAQWQHQLSTWTTASLTMTQ